MIKIYSGILGADSTSKLPESITLQGTTCAVNWKGVGVKEKSPTSPGAQVPSPKEPWEDPVWGPKAVKKRQEAWVAYKARQPKGTYEVEEEESQRLVWQPRGQLVQQALENAQREEEECQQDIINGQEKMEIERSEKERSGVREEGVNASQHASGQGPKRHIHTEFSSEVDEVVLVEGNNTEHGVEDQEGASQESVDLARLLNRDSDGDSVGDSGSEEEIDISMTDARPATRMEVNR